MPEWGTYCIQHQIRCSFRWCVARDSSFSLTAEGIEHCDSTHIVPGNFIKKAAAWISSQFISHPAGWSVITLQLEYLKQSLLIYQPKDITYTSESFGHQRVEAFVLIPTHPLVANGRGI